MAEAAKIDLGLDAKDPYREFRETAERVSAETSDPLSNPRMEAFASQMKVATPDPMASLAALSAPGAAPESAKLKTEGADPSRNAKVEAVLGTPVQQANRPGGDMSNSVRVTDTLVQQGQKFEEAKKSLTEPMNQDNGPKKDILGNTVQEPSLAGRAFNFTAGTVGGGMVVAATAAILGPKAAAAVGFGLAAKDIGGFVSAVNGPATAEQTIIMDSQYKVSAAPAFREGGGKRAVAEARSAGPSPEQQARLASVATPSSPIMVDPAFRAQYASATLGDIKGVQMDKNDPTVIALNERGKELAQQMDTQRQALGTDVRTSWDSVAKARDSGLDVTSERSTFDKLVPKEQVAKLNQFAAPSMTV